MQNNSEEQAHHPPITHQPDHDKYYRNCRLAHGNKNGHLAAHYLLSIFQIKGQFGVHLMHIVANKYRVIYVHLLGVSYCTFLVDSLPTLVVSVAQK